MKRIQELNKAKQQKLRYWQGIVGSVINAAANIGTSYMNNKMAEEREHKAREENYQYNEMSADAADARQRAQWADMYSIGAQARQLKDNGLSLSTMYGGGTGQGGATAPQGSGAAGVQPNIFGIPPIDFAQIGLIAAQTKKVEAETKTISGENARGAAEIGNLLAEKGYKKAAANLAQADAEIKDLEAFVKTQTMNSDVQAAFSTARKLNEEANKAYYEATNEGLNVVYNAETMPQRIQQAGANLANTCAEIILKSSEASLNEERKNALSQQILQGWTKLAIDYHQLKINEKSQRAQQRWYEEQINVLNRELGIKEQKMWLDFGIDCAESVIKMADLITDMIPATAAVKAISHIGQRASSKPAQKQ